jgi:acetyl-CoA carboxylase carboxyl transferase subunit alpha
MRAAERVRRDQRDYRGAKGGAHVDAEASMGNFVKVVSKHLKQLSKLSPEELVDTRVQSFAAMGMYEE